MNIFSLDDGLSVSCPKTGWGAELPKFIADALFIQRQRNKSWILLLPICTAIFIGSQFKDFLCPCIIWIQVCPIDWPTAVFHPVSFFEIHRIQWRTESRPMARSPTKIMQSNRT